MKKLFLILSILPILFWVSCDEERAKVCNFDFGEGEYEEPFRGFLSSKPDILVKSLEYPPFSWLKSDTLVLNRKIEISFNEECIRSKSKAKITFCSTSYKPFENVKIYCNDTLLQNNTYYTKATSDPIVLDIKIKIHPDFGEQLANGFIMVYGTDIDEVNGTSLTEEGMHPVEKLAFSQKIGWPIMIWLLWLLIVIIIIIAIIFIIYLIIKLIKSLISSLSIATKSRIKQKNSMYYKNKKEEDEPWYIKKARELEREVYSRSTVTSKYEKFEELRLHINITADTNPDLNERCYQAMRPSTQKALDKRNEIWWGKTPKNGIRGKWTGERGMSTYILNPISRAYKRAKPFGMTECKYDNYGTPNFDSITENGSIVNISDLYDNYSASGLDKRGGSWNSIQEVAQRQMADNMEYKIHSWWKQNHPGEIFEKYDAFYKWRNANDLVPHEDNNCKTMRLVKRPVHEIFKHCGGIANAKIVKKYLF